ncbi:MAG TPA: molybdenum cofactor guanylyltransferase MobA [Rhodocyclaceae bacterium]|nr:molybdenum cofactor guanylyltransferase MobA [Rhodocyclaceae bacterium]
MKTTLTGVILAGGQGSRMGGLDKGMMPLNGQPLVSWVLERMKPQVDEILIVANRNLDEYRALGHPVVRDIRAGFLGPLAGLEAAMAAAHHNWILTCPVDAPLLCADYANRMLKESRGRPAVATLDGRMQPIYALLPRHALTGLRAFLMAGGRKTSLWLESLAAVEVNFDDCPEAFLDVDTPEQLDELAQRVLNEGLV